LLLRSVFAYRDKKVVSVFGRFFVRPSAFKVKLEFYEKNTNSSSYSYIIGMK
jgi:hypothetical protein